MYMLIVLGFLLFSLSLLFGDFFFSFWKENCYVATL